MWKDSIRNIVVIFQPNILRIVGFYVRHWANVVPELNKQLLCISNYFWVQNYQHYISWLDKSITYCEQT